MTNKKPIFDVAPDLKLGFKLHPEVILKTLVSGFLSEKFQHFQNLPQGLVNHALSKAFSVPGLQGVGDLGYGYFGAKGGANNSSFFVRPVISAAAQPSSRSSTSQNSSVTGTIGVSTNLQFVITKLSNISKTINSLIDKSLKDGLGVDASILNAEIQNIILVFREAANFFNSIGAEQKAKIFLDKVNSVENIKKLSSDPSIKSAETLDYLSFILNQAITELTLSLGSLTSFGSQVGKFSALDSQLNTTLAETWNILNTGATSNNLIKAAFSIAGRLMQKDGVSGQYSWAASFVLSTLKSSGVGGIDAISPAAWTKWGSPVNINLPLNFKPNDLLIFKTLTGIWHMGFLKAFDPKTGKAVVMGGNQGGGASAITITLNTPVFSLKGSIPSGLILAHVKRGWKPSSKAKLPSDMPQSSGQYLAERFGK